jgi:hypothetical protein
MQVEILGLDVSVVPTALRESCEFVGKLGKGGNASNDAGSRQCESNLCRDRHRVPRRVVEILWQEVVDDR